MKKMTKLVGAMIVTGMLAFGATGARAADDIAVVVKIGGIPWFNSMEQGIKKAGGELGVNAWMVGPTEADAAQQVRAVEDLIARKAKVIAHRLQLSDQLAWIDLEQRGYRESDPLPLYRFIRAPVYLRDVRTGELTDLFTFQADREIPAQAHLCLDSISKLEALGSQGPLYVQLPSGHRVYDGLSAKARDQYQVVHQLDASQLQAVVAQVRDKVLDWALELAKAGIEGLTRALARDLGGHLIANRDPWPA